MMDVKAIRRAIAAACRNVDSPRQLEALHYLPGAIDPPFAYPAETDGNYNEAVGGVAGVVITLRVLTSRAEDQAGQELLDDYLASTGITSIKAAIEADQTLGGQCDFVTVTGWTGYRTYEIAAADYFGAELDVVVG